MWKTHQRLSQNRPPRYSSPVSSSERAWRAWVIERVVNSQVRSVVLPSATTPPLTSVERLEKMSLRASDLQSLLSSVRETDNTSLGLALAVVLLTAYGFVCFFRRIVSSDERKFWSSHAWAGVKHLIFPRTRAGLDAIRRTREIVEDGYEKVRCIHSS
jgi:hypothetical protein